VLSFDIEEHDRIEAASHLQVSQDLRLRYRDRMVAATDWILEQLAERAIRATFFIVGQIATQRPALVRQIAEAGHEIASHSWDHRRVLALDASTFRADLLRSKQSLEEAAGVPVVGYRAPTFSITRANPWAIDVLAEAGFLYDSSIYPVRHDRYGVPDAPLCPFRAHGPAHSILELPPLALRLGRWALPVGGGGYFRLFPTALLERGIAQIQRAHGPRVATLYFHPWEFDPGQPRLNLRGLSRFRTYVGIRRSRPRLAALLERHSYTRACDAARALLESPVALPDYNLTGVPGRWSIPS
jgi:polysaccharide deacetylase family protein (PEP-CTERM system associated)